jgi:hypothetical protein
MLNSLFVSYLMLFALNNINYYPPKPLEEATELIVPTSTDSVAENESAINRTREFMDRLAQFESNNNPTKVSNSKTYIGKYQLGPLALEEAGFKVSTRAFIKNPNVFPEDKQDEAFLKYCLANKDYLQREIDKYSGTTIKGNTITKAGILAAAHLVGYYPTKNYLRSHGRIDKADGNGRRCSFYIKKFQDLDDEHIAITEELKNYD